MGTPNVCGHSLCNLGATKKYGMADYEERIDHNFIISFTGLFLTVLLAVEMQRMHWNIFEEQWQTYEIFWVLFLSAQTGIPVSISFWLLPWEHMWTAASGF